jgi:hypothetical protein
MPSASTLAPVFAAKFMYHDCQKDVQFIMKGANGGNIIHAIPKRADNLGLYYDISWGSDDYLMTYFVGPEEGLK